MIRIIQSLLSFNHRARPRRGHGVAIRIFALTAA